MAQNDFARLAVYLSPEQAEDVRTHAFCLKMSASRWIKNAIAEQLKKENEIWEQVNADVHATADRMIAENDED